MSLGDLSEFSAGLKNQNRLIEVIKEINPKPEIIWNYKSKLRFDKTGKLKLS